jgi:hypothetical protein
MAATPLLGLSLPADGTTNWGTLVNTSITALIDSAVAGTTTLSSDADVTLTTTTEATNQARQAVLLCTGSRAAIRTITAPAQSKTYVVINNTSGSFGVKIVGAGPTVGITVPNGRAYMVAWNGSDFVITGITTINLATDVTGTLPIANGGTNSTAAPTAGGAAYGTGTAYAVTAAGTSGQVLTSAGASAPTWSSLPANVSSISFGSIGLTPSTATTGAVTVGGTLGTANGGTNLTTFGANQVFYASSASVMSQSSALTFDGSTLSVNNVNVGRGAGAVSANTAIGNGTLSSNTSGSQNTAIGYAALSSNLTGNTQTALGSNTMAVMRGSSNTAVGQGAMYGSGTIANNTGFSNVAVGQGAMVGLSSGSYNVGVGVGAVATLTTGYSNTAVGYQAAYNSTTGYENVAVGISALYNNTTGTAGVAVGKGALYFMRGGGNIGVGYEVMQGSGTPANNTGYYNVAIGYRALYSITTANTNVAVGHLAGFDITTGTKNAILGSYSGNQGGLDIRTASNYIVLSDGDGNPRAYWNAANATFNGQLTVVNTLKTAVGSVSGSGTITPASNLYNQFDVEAFAGAITIAAPTGSPVNGQKLLIKITDDGVARGITWNAIYRAFVGAPLPTTTVAGKVIYVGCIYNNTNPASIKWDVVAVTTQA